MDVILCTLLKKQNQILLQKIAEEYQLDEQRIMKMYHTPTFYQVEKTPSKYRIEQVGKK